MTCDTPLLSIMWKQMSYTIQRPPSDVALGFAIGGAYHHLGTQHMGCPLHDFSRNLGCSMQDAAATFDRVLLVVSRPVAALVRARIRSDR